MSHSYPSFGTGDYRSTALIVKNADGTYACDLRYDSYEIRTGKYALPGLPAVYANEEQAETLEIVLKDSISGVKVRLLYGVLSEFDVITRSVNVENTGETKVILEKVQSASLDFINGDYDLLTFYGRHVLERNLQRQPVGHGAQVIGSRRGFSSHQYNPFMILADHETNEDFGRCH